MQPYIKTQPAPCHIGQRIRLDHMGNDPCPIPAGATGTVIGLCPYRDTWQIGVAWEVAGPLREHRSLGLVWPIDRFTILKPECP